MDMGTNTANIISDINKMMHKLRNLKDLMMIANSLL